MAHYIGLIHKELESDYGIIFPDFPGCISAGSSVEEVLQQGSEALAFHVAGMRRDGDDIPEPRTLDAIKAAADDWIDWSDALTVLVPLLPQVGRSVQVNVTLDERLVAEIDAVAANRSAFLAEAALVLLGRRA